MDIAKDVYVKGGVFGENANTEENVDKVLFVNKSSQSKEMNLEKKNGSISVFLETDDD